MHAHPFNKTDISKTDISKTEINKTDINDTDGQPALVSIHDLMPENLEEVKGLLSLCQAHDIHPVTLLIVPGRPWLPSQIATLRAWAEEGHVLAGHGWQHCTETIGGIGHWLHSRLISRNVAEHLAVDEVSIAGLITHCHAWFEQHGLPAPYLYVPPAWAMGGISRATLRGLPFSHYETLTGVYDAANDRFQRLPVLGFEADRAWRAPLLRLSNALNAARARRRPLRIAIHPHDMHYRLATRLRQWLAAPLYCLTYTEIGPGNEVTASR